MRKIFLGVCVTLAIASVGVVAQDKKSDKEISYREIGASLPELRVVDSNKHVYTREDFKSNGHLFLFMFNPTCGHCIHMAKLISDNKEDFKKTKVLFLAGPQMMPYLPSFYQASSIGQAPEMKVGIDSAAAVDKLYDYKMLPQLNIYDKDRKLIRVLYGDIALDTMKRYVP